MFTGEATRLLRELVIALELVYSHKPSKKELKAVDEWLRESGLFLRITGELEDRKEVIAMKTEKCGGTKGKGKGKGK